MGADGIDTRLLTELTDQSQDLNSDAVRITREALGEFTEQQHEARASRGRGAGGMAAGLLGIGALLFGTGRANAASASPSSNDIMALQTAASIENLAVSVYTTAAGLSFIKSGNATVAAFITKTTAQHTAHAQAFNAAITQAGGKTQTAPDPKYAAVVKSALPTITSPADVVKLAITLEDVAAQTYTKYVSEVSTSSLRTLFGSVAPVEAQHRSVLLAVQALLAGGGADLIAIPTNAAKLPAAAGSVGFPDAFYSTTSASPTSEGAVS
jgi:rubrerythrin